MARYNDYTLGHAVLSTPPPPPYVDLKSQLNGQEVEEVRLS